VGIQYVRYGTIGTVERRRICVFCGSSRNVKPIYEEAARQVARELVKRDLGLVYGGAATGLMGILADTVLEHGGEVIGVIPHVLVSNEVAHEGLTRLYVVDSLEERKRKMASLADAFLVLPGGFGTLDELMEVVTWKILGVDERPLGIWNVAGYWNKFFEFLDYAMAEGFVRPHHRRLLVEEEDLGVLLDWLVGCSALER